MTVGSVRVAVAAAVGKSLLSLCNNVVEVREGAVVVSRVVGEGSIIVRIGVLLDWDKLCRHWVVSVGNIGVVIVNRGLGVVHAVLVVLISDVGVGRLWDVGVGRGVDVVSLLVVSSVLWQELSVLQLVKGKLRCEFVSLGFNLCAVVWALSWDGVIVGLWAISLDEHRVVLKVLGKLWVENEVRGLTLV